jgi:LysR family transcriptional regulator, glycine cleavage system transcriptional activator
MLTLRIGVCMSKDEFPVLSGALRAFEAAARHQSIKTASTELHVTPAAVSRHIKKLERLLGRPLFERHYRRIASTADGEMLLGAVTTGLSHIQSAVTRLSASQRPNRLVISVDPDFAGLWLVPRLGEFYAIAPNTLVEIRAEKSANSLHGRRIDCAIQYAEAGMELKNSEMLFRSRLFPVCAPGLMKMRPLRSPEDLQHHTLLHDRSIVEWQEYLQSSPKTINVDVRSGAVFSETAHCLDAAARGQGVAIGDDFLAAMHLSEGRLVKPFDSTRYSKNAYYFIVPKRGAQHPAVTIFRNWLFQSIRRQRNLRIRRIGSR